MRNRSSVGDAVGEQDSSSSFVDHFWTVVAIRSVVVGYAGAVGDGAETRRLASVGRQMECDVGYVGRQLDSGIEEASFAALPSRGESDLIHHRHHHHRPSFPSH